jgi:hypothetical protein
MSFRPVPADESPMEPAGDKSPDASPVSGRHHETVLTAEELHALLGDPT